jgi:hypothetical protein
MDAMLDAPPGGQILAFEAPAPMRGALRGRTYCAGPLPSVTVAVWLVPD